MAWIEKREGKKGISYRISVSSGIDSNGKQIIRRKTWVPEPNMSQKKLEKTLQAVTLEFERYVEQGFQIDNRKTFSEYAEYVIDLKERNGLKPRTIDRYRDLMIRINVAIGHKKLVDILPHHLNEFYKNLGEQGIRIGTERATAKINFKELLAERSMAQAELARRTGISAVTVGATVQGRAFHCVVRKR